MRNQDSSNANFSFDKQLNYQSIKFAIPKQLFCNYFQNLDNLVRLPTGCGEQNMILLAPNVQVIHYLENIRKVNHQLKNRAINFIKKGR